jgi:hypothetical protein
MIEQINPHRPHHFYVGAIVGVFGFRFVWPFFPRLGVIFVGVGMSIMTDDFVTHATGHDTILDTVEQLLYDGLTEVNLINE